LIILVVKRDGNFHNKDDSKVVIFCSLQQKRKMTIQLKPWMKHMAGMYVCTKFS